ncbi:MAG: ACP S-malonyltransferase [Anaerohalosphaeraceae bacterium]
MSKIAFIFPGQGAQLVGMGADIAAAFPKTTALFDKACQIVGFDLKSLCFQGPEDKLNSTEISQPAIFTVSAALLDLVREKAPALTPQVTAGLSMGEYTALYAAGLMSFEDALKLVLKRGQAMQTTANASRGGMVSLIGLDEPKVRQLCDEASEGQLLTPANFNCPGQIVISGAIEACQRAAGLAEKYGAMKAVPLAVAGAFHTEMMKPAAEALGQALAGCPLKNPTAIQVIANITADYYGSAEQIRQGLVRQLVEPILWQKCMEKLIADGVTKFVEIGPNRVLTGLMKRIHRRADIVNISSLESLESL